MHGKKGKSLTSGVEIYVPFVQDQELPTKFLKNKRDRDSVENPSCSNKCRLCINNVGDINQIIAGCSQILAIYYLPLIHDEVVKTMLNAHLNNIFHDQQNRKLFLVILQKTSTRILWNISIKTATKIPHSKPKFVLWNKEIKFCRIIKFSCPLDANIGRNVNEKLETYGPLI